jgi:hypothetical protein
MPPEWRPRITTPAGRREPEIRKGHYKGIHESAQPGPRCPGLAGLLHFADNQAMPLPPPPFRRHSNKANNELLFKGVLCTLIGLAVLISPYFINSPGMQNIVAKASLVGWFALVLGCAFIGVYLRRRFAGKTGPSGPL